MTTLLLIAIIVGLVLCVALAIATIVFIRKL